MRAARHPTPSPPPGRVLVTGVGGFIGTNLTRSLLAAGTTVVGIDARVDEPRQRANLDSLDPGSLTVIGADLLDVDLAKLLRSVDAVVHLAGSPGVQSSWSSGFDHHVRNNVVTTQRLLEAALDAPRQRIVVASSSSVYGTVATGAAREDDPLQPLSPYGASKAAMELLLGSYRERGVAVLPLRYFTVYGAHQRPDMAMHRIIEATRGGSPFVLRGDGEQVRNFTNVDDVVRATVAALGARTCDPINIGGPGTATVNEVIGLVESIVGAPVRRAFGVAVAGDPARTSADIDRARTTLGWEPRVGLREGLTRQIEWQLSTAPQHAPATPYR